jgi:hypothetical protein
MSAGLLKRSNLLLSIVLGFVSWFVLILVWTHSAQGGPVDRAISTFLAPASWLAQRIGGLFFPDYLVPHSTGWHLVPLFDTVGRIVLLTITWYVCIRIKRRKATGESDGEGIRIEYLCCRIDLRLWSTTAHALIAHSTPRPMCSFALEGFQFSGLKVGRPSTNASSSAES